MTTAETPLPGPPEPWSSTEVPTPRDGPPWHMTDMIDAEPGVTRRLLETLRSADSSAARLAEVVRATAAGGGHVTVTGCGTSEHAAQAGAEILRDALRTAGLPSRAVAPAQAFELALDPPGAGTLVIGVTHEGGTAATNAALEAARAAGARTAVVTVTDRSPAAALADVVVETHELDRGWCHVVGYLSPIVALAAVGGHVAGRPLDPGQAAELVRAGTGAGDAAERIAARLADARRVLVIASGADRPAGHELVLKIEEGSWLPAAYRDLETFLHGHLPATGESTGLVLLLTDRSARPRRLGRALQALRAAQVLGLRSAAILAGAIDREIDPALTPAGRINVPDEPALPAPVAALLGTAAPLQLVAERLARARGTNPDPIRRDHPRYAAAAEAAEGSDT